MILRVNSGTHPDSHGIRFRRGERMVGRVWDSAQPLVVNDYPNWLERRPLPTERTPQAVAVVPIMAGEVCVGVIELVRRVSDLPFTADDIAITQRFCALTALVLDNARLFEIAHQELSERRRIQQRLSTQYLVARALATHWCLRTAALMRWQKRLSSSPTSSSPM